MDSQLSFCFRMRCFFCTPIKSCSRVGLMAKHAIHLSDLSKASFFVFSSGVGLFFGRSSQQSFFYPISFVPFADPMAACKAEG